MIEISCDKAWENLIDQNKLKQILKVFIKILFQNESKLSLYITGDEKVQKLNNVFRGKNRPTDILSWSYSGNNRSVKWYEYSEEDLTVGDLVISAESAQKQANENGWDLETEIIRLLAHGCAHLANWDHESSEEEDREMLNIEISLLEKVSIFNIY